MKIAIVIPSADMVHADFAACLARLIVTSASNGIAIAIVNPRSSLIQKGRYDGIKQALNVGADKILFIDSDQTFPERSMIQLLQANKKIVGATSVMRRPPHEFTARDRDGKRIDFSNRKGLHQVESNGFHLCLIDAEVFRKMPEPWFEVLFKDGQWISEDESFFKGAIKAGYKIWVDADLSKDVGHLGVKEFFYE